MYATRAIGLDGRPIPLNYKCMGDGDPKHSCGKTLYFSHDVVDGRSTHRYVSCLDHHTWDFTIATADRTEIAVRHPGELIDDSIGRPKHQRLERPILVGIMTSDEDAFIDAAQELHEAIVQSELPGSYRIIQAAEPVKPPPKRPKRQPPKRKPRHKRT